MSFVVSYSVIVKKIKANDNVYFTSRVFVETRSFIRQEVCEGKAEYFVNFVFPISFSIQMIISEVFTLTLPKTKKDHEQVQSATATIILPTQSSPTSFEEEQRYTPSSETATISRPFSRKRVWKLYWTKKLEWGHFYILQSQNTTLSQITYWKMHFWTQ